MSNIFGTTGSTGSTGSNGLPTVLPPVSNAKPMVVPARIATGLGLPSGAVLLYNPPAKAGVAQAPYPPVTGKELYEAIQSSGYTSQQKSGLITALFPSGFNPNGKNASKYYSAVTTNLNISKYNLGDYTVPTPEIVAKTPVTPTVTPSTTVGGPVTAGASRTSAGAIESAYGVVESYLENWGLKSEAKKVYKIITDPRNNITNTRELVEIIRGNLPSSLGPEAQKEFKQAYDSAFPGLSAYNASLERNPNSPNVFMTEAAYQSYAQRVRDTATQYGVPAPSKQDVGQLLNNNVSAVEYQQRVQDIYSAVQNADAGTKAILQREFGINENDIKGYLATGKVPGRKGAQGLPEMQRQVASAEIQDYANRVGLTGVAGRTGNQLADMARLASTAGNQALGYGVSQIEGSLLGASRDVALTKALPGSSTPTVNTNTLIASQLAGFGGTNQVAAQTEVARAEQAKAAPFEKGGGYAESQKGVIGLGAART